MKVGRRAVIQFLVRSVEVVEVEIAPQVLLSFAGAAIIIQIDLLVFDAAPEPFSEDVVRRAAVAIHADLDSRRQEPFGQTRAGDLTALIGVTDFLVSA